MQVEGQGGRLGYFKTLSGWATDETRLYLITSYLVKSWQKPVAMAVKY